MPSDQRQWLREAIEKNVFVRKNQEKIVSEDGRESAWLFDFRRIFLKGDTLDVFASLFFERFDGGRDIQVGGMEAAAIPLVTALVMKAQEKRRALNGFFIRKSRKKSGLLRSVEGALTDEDIVLVDDLINSGRSLMKQVEILEQLGKKVTAIFVVIRFRPLQDYGYFEEKHIRIESVFTLDDFRETLGLALLEEKKTAPTPMPYTVEWCFRSKHPDHQFVLPKAGLVLDDTRVYCASDRGTVRALDQRDGTIAWEYQVGVLPRGEHIFSTPVLFENLICFGAYDGNVYALDKRTGRRKWVFMEADWVESGPIVVPSLGIVVVGLRFGLWKRQGGIIALDLKTGAKRFLRMVSSGVVGSPVYCRQNKSIIFGSDDGTIYSVSMSSGKIIWTQKTGAAIKGAGVCDEAGGRVIFNSMDGNVYALDAATGTEIWRYAAEFGLYGTPLLVAGRLYVASLDKRVYCLDASTGKRQWSFLTRGRIFSSPVIIGTCLYIGSNDGCLYGLDPQTGKSVSFFQATERITNQPVYSRVQDRFFVPTVANEVYCLSLKV